MNNWLLISLFCLSFFALPQPVAAQVTSVIEGTIADSQGRVIRGAEINLTGVLVNREIKVLSDQAGTYRLVGLQPGTYQLQVKKDGFAVQVYEGLLVTVNRLLIFDVVLEISAVQAAVTINSNLRMLDTGSSSSGTTILPQQIEEMPISGRNYLDLLQLVPGVALKRQVDPGSDAGVPILGERSGNAVYLIDGMPNSNAVNGGPAAPFDQDSILEFQVLTAGYKAEFGHGSGGVVNVVTKRGTDRWHGRSSLFHPNLKS